MDVAQDISMGGPRHQVVDMAKADSNESMGSKGSSQGMRVDFNPGSDQDMPVDPESDESSDKGMDVDEDHMMVDTLKLFNNEGRSENCVWVSTARLLGFTSVGELQDEVGMIAPVGGAELSECYEFRIALQNYYERTRGQRVTWTLLKERLPLNADCVLLLHRERDDYRHAINRIGGQFLDFQHNDEGDDRSVLVRESNLVQSWFFEPARAERTSSDDE